jgi:hypothetical protein
VSQFEFVRIHKTHRMTPGMYAGVTDRLWSMEDIVTLIENAEVQRVMASRIAQLSVG